MMPKGIAAAGYARRSTDMQEQSIPDQQACVERYAKENGYHVVRWYIDDAISGTSAKGREAFERMIQDAEHGKDFEAVLCYDISRFSRGGTNETGFYLHRLTQAGVRAIFTAEGIPEGDEGELLQGVKSWQARQFSVKLSRDCIRGTISHILQRQCAPGGIPPYGYDKQYLTTAGQVLRTLRWFPDGRKQELGPDGKLVRLLEANETLKKAKSDLVRYIPSTPDRVVVVRRIFEQSAAGFGYHHIAARLNEAGIPNATGGQWCQSEIKRVLTNPAYRGAVAWNRRTMGKLHGVGRDGKLRPKRGKGDHLNPQEDWYVVENAHEPLVSAEAFDAVQTGIAKRRLQGGLARPTQRALLSGLIVCTHCKHNYVQKFTSNSGPNNARYRYYADGGYNKGGSTVCRLTNIPADALDQWVLEQAQGVLLGDHAGTAQAIATFVEKVRAKQQKPENTAALEKDLDEAQRRLRAMTTMMTDLSYGGFDELQASFNALKAKRDALQAELERRKSHTGQRFNAAELRAWASERLRTFDRIKAGEATIFEARQVLQTFVDHIEINPHQRTGTLFLPSDACSALTSEVSNRVSLGDQRDGQQHRRAGQQARDVGGPVEDPIAGDEVRQPREDADAQQPAAADASDHGIGFDGGPGRRAAPGFVRGQQEQRDKRKQVEQPRAALCRGRAQRQPDTWCAKQRAAGGRCDKAQRDIAVAGR